MIKITKISKEQFNLINDLNSVNILFKDGQIWLKVDEICELFKVNKLEILKQLFLLINDNYKNFGNVEEIYNKKSGKYEKYYDLETVISIGYRLKSFENTKFICKANKMLKNYSLIRKSNFNKTKIDFSNIKNLFNFSKINLNLLFNNSI